MSLEQLVDNSITDKIYGNCPHSNTMFYIKKITENKI